MRVESARSSWWEWIEHGPVSVIKTSVPNYFLKDLGAGHPGWRPSAVTGLYDEEDHFQ